MSRPLTTTFETLTKSKNAAADALLNTVLGRDACELTSMALGSALSRRGKAAHLKVIARWDQLDQSDRAAVFAAQGRLSAALRDAVLSTDSQLFANACEIIAQTNEFDLVPTLVTLAENRSSPHSSLAVSLVLELAERLSDLLHNPKQSGEQRDPKVLRAHLFDALHRSIERYRYHKLDAIVECFVLLCGAQDALLLTILDDPHHPCFQALSCVLTKSTHQGIVQLLLELLESDQPPATLFGVICHRCDRGFLTRFFQCCDENTGATMQRNLKQLRVLNWLNDPTNRLSTFDPLVQASAARTLTKTGVPRKLLLEAWEELLRNGKASGRAAACEALADISGVRTNELVLRATQDPEPEVQAAAIRQLRQRHIPGTMPLLEAVLDSPVEILRQAAREALSEFTFESYFSDFEMLSDEVRFTTGSLVRRVDQQFADKLGQELQSPVLKQRLRAMRIAELLGMVPLVVEPLLECLENSDHMIRATAAECLQHCPTSEVRSALQRSTGDRSGTVQNAARSSLAAFSSLNPPSLPGATEVPR